jgi:cytochrome c oxidase cbb3-type subunit 3
MAKAKQPAETTEAPVDEELLIGDHEYDGIQEYDNPLPRWWTLIYVGTIVFSVGYYVHYHLGEGEGVLAAYAAEASAAEKNAPALVNVTEEALASIVGSAAGVTAGKEVFVARCAVCHGDSAEGKIGPNLTDHHWIHGAGSLTDIYKTTSEGVAAKGMPAWAKQLTPKELQNVVGFVGSLRGKMTPGKTAEGTEHAPK